MNNENWNDLDNILCQLLDDSIVPDDIFKYVLQECGLSLENFEHLHTLVKKNLEMSEDNKMGLGENYFDKNKPQYTDDQLLECPRISVYGDRVKKIEAHELDRMNEAEYNLNEVHYDLTSLANEHNSGDVNCQFSGKQIFRNFDGDDDEILKFYRSGLEQGLFVIVAEGDDD